MKIEGVVNLNKARLQARLISAASKAEQAKLD